MGCAQTGPKNCWFFVYYPAFEKVTKAMFYFEKSVSFNSQFEQQHIV